MMLDLDPEYVFVVRKILSTFVPDKTIWVYGSRIKGTAHAGSDLDLVIIDTDETLPSETLSTLKTAFSESNLPIKVDISNWVDMPQAFKDEIEKIHEVFQGPKT